MCPFVVRLFCVLTVLLVWLPRAEANQPDTIPGMVVTATGAGPATLWCTGSVADVLQGRLTEQAHRWIRADAFAVGFEAGSPEGVESFGEFLVVDGVAYAKSTDETSAQYYQVIHGDRFVSPGALLVPLDAAAAFRVEVGREDDHSTRTLTALYGEMCEIAGGPCAFAGRIEFQTCETLAISRAPIHGEEIMANRSRYYEFGPATRDDVQGYIMGCAADFRAEMAPELKTSLERVLYNNPYDKGTGPVAHAHVLILARHASTTGRVVPNDVEDVNHLLSQSVVKRASLDLYPIQELEELPAEALIAEDALAP